MSRHEPEEHKQSPTPPPRMTERVDEEREASEAREEREARARTRTHDERSADDEPWICRGID